MKQQHNNPPEGKTDVLFWSDSFGAEGFVLGWKFGWNKTDCDDTREDGAPSSRVQPRTGMMIAAGVVSASETSFHQLRSKIRAIQQTHCYCCHCKAIDRSMDRDSAICCSGCTKRCLFENLQMVAYCVADAEPSKTRKDNSSTHDLPTIFVSRSSGNPTLAGSEHAQIVFFDSSGATRYRYQHSLTPTGNGSCSVFSHFVLNRLTHAAVVVSVVLAASNISSKNNVSDTSRKQRPVRDGASSSSRIPTKPKQSPTTKRLQSPLLVPAWKRYSSWARHCTDRSSSANPWIALFHKRRTERLCTHSTDTCSCCDRRVSRLSFMSLMDESDQQDSASRNVVDAVLGCMIFLAVVWWVVVKQGLKQDSTYFNDLTIIMQTHYRFLHSGLEWIERFPLGFKLNESLLRNVGLEVHRFWKMHEWLALRLLSYVSSSACFANTAAATLALLSLRTGASGVCAVCVDCLKVARMHVSVVASATRFVYSCELYLLAALWRVFRGKKRNILRLRTDTMEYDSTQLLLFTILFVVALFLFTTIFVYHVFFTVLQLGGDLLELPFTLMYTFVRCGPWGSLMLRRRKPGLFTQSFVLDIRHSDEGNVHRDVTTMRPQIASYTKILSQELIPMIGKIFLRIASFVFGSLIGIHPESYSLLDFVMLSIGAARPP